MSWRGHKGFVSLADQKDRAAPELDVEVKGVVGLDVPLTPESLAEAIMRHRAPRRLKAAIGRALTDEKAPIRLLIVRNKIGRPALHEFGVMGRANALEMERFINDALARGVPQKIAFAEASERFGVGRSTIFTRLREVREWRARIPPLEDAVFSPDPFLPQKSEGRRSRRKSK